MDKNSYADYFTELCNNLKNPKGYKKNSNSSVIVFFTVCQILNYTTKPANKFALTVLNGNSLEYQCRCYDWENASDNVL